VLVGTAAEISKVGRGRGVKVGGGVGLGISVGGMGVAVGSANWVIATIVHADEMAVPSTSAGAKVGVPCGPQADKRTTIASSKGKILLNIFISIFLLLIIALLFYYNMIFENR
jgi:hypothetical protein